ncbi:MAG: protease inhibitor I9 family protein, partial [Holophagales bacterium]|nr:protease inhibitor I9 family protein [Holophagales bacterium]
MTAKQSDLSLGNRPRTALPIPTAAGRLSAGLLAAGLTLGVLYFELGTVRPGALGEAPSGTTFGAGEHFAAIPEKAAGSTTIHDATDPDATIPKAAGAAVGDFLVRSSSADRAAALVRAAGGTIGKRLGLIDAVSARLTPQAVERLSRSSEVRRIWPDRSVQVSSAGVEAPRGRGSEGEKIFFSFGDPTYYPTQVGASLAHLVGIDGSGVTVAVIDTGFWRKQGLKKNADKDFRV